MNPSSLGGNPWGGGGAMGGPRSMLGEGAPMSAWPGGGCPPPCGGGGIIMEGGGPPACGGIPKGGGMPGGGWMEVSGGEVAMA